MYKLTMRWSAFRLFAFLRFGTFMIPKTTTYAASSLDKSRDRTHVGVLDPDVMYLVVTVCRQ